MTIVCVDNTPIMLQSLKENADKAYPYANVQTFLSAAPALEYAKKNGCDVNPKVNIIFVTVCSESEHARADMRLKPSGYLTKEATSAQILEELQNLRYPVA